MENLSAFDEAHKILNKAQAVSPIISQNWFSPSCKKLNNQLKSH